MKKLIICAALAMVAATGARAELRTGKLDNGMTYYIRSNDTPSGQADFFLAQRAGSVVEKENERGLAHFLEHMCFNGTEHFPDNTLISWLERNGVKFGKNLNAYTSTDETVYNISKVPLKNSGVLDSCLLIVRDWCTGLTLDDAAIDAERGVIENEWRHRNSAANRQLEKALPELYAGSIYGHRMPIGTMEIVKNFKPKTLRGFYERWYHPKNQAVIVVGDFDAADVENRVRNMFGSIKRSGKVIDGLPEVKQGDGLRIVTQHDPEQTTNLVQLHFLNDRLTDTREELVAQMAGAMLAERFDDIEADPNCPYTNLGLGETKYLVSNGVGTFVMRGVAKPGRSAEALGVWYKELARAAKHGFSDEELAHVRAEIEADLRERIRKAAKTPSTEYARMYVRDFIDRETPEEIAAECERKLELLEGISAGEPSLYISQVVAPGLANGVVLAYSPENDTQATEAEELRKALLAVDESTLTPYSPAAVHLAILDKEPERGNIVSEKPYVIEGATEYLLSNGIKVVAWPSTDVPGQIYVRGISEGGLSQNYTDAEAPTFKMLNEVLNSCGMGQLSNSDLRRVANGRKMATSIKITNTEETIEASTTREDMRDAFRMLYGKATELNMDSVSVQALLEGKRNQLLNRSTNPIQVMGDSIHSNVYSHHPLGLKETVETIDSVKPELALSVFRDRFTDMGDFTFVVAGDFDTDSLRDCMERYIASLPSAGREEKAKDIGYHFTRDNREILFSREMENPIGVVYNFYTGNSRYDLEHVLAASAFGQIFKTRLLAELREKRGLTYSIQGHCAVAADMNGGDEPAIMMPAYIKVTPGHEKEVNDYVNSTLADMLTNGVTDEELASAKEYLAKNYEESITDNAYRLLVVRAMERHGVDLHSKYRETLDALKDLRPYVSGMRDWHTTIMMTNK